MNKTKIKKVLSALAVGALVAAQANVFAAQIGTGSVVGEPTFDTIIDWNGTYTAASASGTVTGIKVLATVAPTINMTLSAKEINLGALAAGVTASGTIDIEVGTNAANGVTITAQSGSGGLTNTSDNALQINSLVADGSAESYRFESTANAFDSTVTGFANTGDLTLVEMNNTTPVTIYNTNKPELADGTNADVTFRVEATSNAQTAAGNYEDSLNFMVTGNF
jgi:hypothetical protein